jgi:hypothetical protein
LPDGFQVLTCDEASCPLAGKKPSQVLADAAAEVEIEQLERMYEL